MTFKAVAWALEQPLPTNEKMVLLILAEASNEEGYSWPGMRTLARKASMSESTARRMIRKLCERGFVTLIPHYRDDGGRSSNGYYIHPPVNLTGGVPPVTADTTPLSRSTALEPSVEPPSTKKPRAKKNPIPLPEDWTPTEEHKAMAMARGLDVEEQALAFRFHAEANDRRQAVWNAAFSQWIMNAKPSRAYVPSNRTDRPAVPAAPRYPDAPPVDDDWQPYFPPPLEN